MEELLGNGRSKLFRVHESISCVLFWHVPI